MAKPTFAKLGLTKNTEVKTFTYAGQEIEVKQYLPIEDKLSLIANAINNTLMTDENRFPNNVKLKMYLKLECVFKYTNLVFTEKQKEDLPKLYDLLEGNGIIKMIEDKMPEYDMLYLEEDAREILAAMHQYNNSIYGILDNVKNNYSDMELDINKLKEEMANSENLDIVSQVVTKLS